MKVEICANESLRVVPNAVHDLDSIPHHGEVLSADASRGQGGDLRLKDLAHFGQVRGPVPLAHLDHQVE